MKESLIIFSSKFYMEAAEGGVVSKRFPLDAWQQIIWDDNCRVAASNHAKAPVHK